MKTYILILFSSLLFSTFINAQQNTMLKKISDIKDVGPPIDTTDFFPMQIGNYWEYAAFTADGYTYFSISIIGDTTMPNGKNYKIFAEKYFYNSAYNYILFFRQDSNKVYYAFPYAMCSNGEYIYLDFLKPDSTYWKVCRDLSNCGNARGIARTYYDYTYYGFLQKPLETKQFQDVYADSLGAIWTPCESDEYWLSKGIGITRIFKFNVGDFWLQGAIINGVKFGTITDIRKEKFAAPINLKIEAYPNPFNSTVTLKLNLPSRGFTEVSIYNVLGKKVKTISKGYKQAGIYNIRYNADHLTSGVYLVLLRQNQFVSCQKVILLK